MRETKVKKKRRIWPIVVATLVVILLIGYGGVTMYTNANVKRPVWNSVSKEETELIAETTEVAMQEYLGTQLENEQSVGYIYLEDLTDEELAQLCNTVATTVQENVLNRLTADTLTQMEQDIINQVNETLVTQEGDSITQEDIDYLTNSILVLVEENIYKQLENLVSKSELNEITNQINSNMNKLESQLADLESKFKTLSSELDTLKAGLNSADTPTQSDVIALQTGITELEVNLSSLEQTAEKYNTNNQYLITKLSTDLGKRLDEHTLQIVTLQESLAILQQEVTDLSALSMERYTMLEDMIVTNVDELNQNLTETSIELTSYIEGNSTEINNVKASLEETRLSLVDYINITNSGQDTYLNELVQSVETAVDTINEGIADAEKDLTDTIVDINAELIDAVENERISKDKALQNLSDALSDSLVNLKEHTDTSIQYLRDNLFRYNWSVDDAGEDVLTIITPESYWNG